MDKETISVIVPAYNIGPYLGRCLDSLLAQTWEPLQILVVDDGSQDHTWQVAQQYARNHPNIQAIHQDNGGVTAARLRGLESASGQWIGFVDGDDEVEPQMYQRLLENAKTYGADISHCSQQVIFPDGRIHRECEGEILRQQDRKTGLEDLLDGGLVKAGLCTKLYRRELFAGLGAFMDLSLRNNEDFLMNYYLFSQANTAVFEGVCPYHYLLRQGSASYGQLESYVILDPVRARQHILHHCEPELVPAARQCLIRNCLFGYSRLAMEKKGAFPQEEQILRQQLLELRPYLGLTCRRNRILAAMICHAPWSFRLAFRLYAAIFRRKEQH